MKGRDSCPKRLGPVTGSAAGSGCQRPCPGGRSPSEGSAGPAIVAPCLLVSDWPGKPRSRGTQHPAAVRAAGPRACALTSALRVGTPRPADHHGMMHHFHASAAKAAPLAASRRRRLCRISSGDSRWPRRRPGAGAAGGSLVHIELSASSSFAQEHQSGLGPPRRCRSSHCCRLLPPPGESSLGP